MTTGGQMGGMSNGELAAQRARWLAELAGALDEACELVERLATGESHAVAIDLSARIDAARSEVETLRLKRSRGGGQDFGPEWSNGVPWKLSAWRSCGSTLG